MNQSNFSKEKVNNISILTLISRLVASLTFKSKILISNLHKFNDFKEDNWFWMSTLGKIKERVSCIHLHWHKHFVLF